MADISTITLPDNNTYNLKDSRLVTATTSAAGIVQPDGTSIAVSSGVISIADSPSFTGTPTAPTAASGTNTTQLATTAFVNVAVNSVVGQYSTNGSATSVPTAKDTTLCNTGSLEAGYHYVILAEASFPSNSTGRRVIFLASSNTGSSIDRFCKRTQPAVSGDVTQIQLVYLCHPSSATTYYLRAYQNSGSSQNVTGGIRVFKFKVGQ
jgi:hypothetical protein